MLFSILGYFKVIHNNFERSETGGIDRLNLNIPSKRLEKQMRKVSRYLLAVSVLTGLTFGTLACKFPGSSDSSSGGGSGANPFGGNGAGGTFSASDLVKTWTLSSCTPGTEPITGSTNYSMTLNLFAGGAFSFIQLWYAGTCSPVNYSVIYSVQGSYTVGGLISGSSSLQSIQFTSSASDIMAMTTGVQGQFNADCGGTSPYSGGTSSANNGVHKSSYMFNCMHVTFPSSGNAIMNNVAGFSTGVLTLGNTYDGIPGVFAGFSVPTTASLTFN